MYRICVDFDFEEEKIDEYLKMVEIDEKYKGIPAYEWQQTMTKEQKQQDRKKRLLEAERKKRQEIRLKAIQEEKERRKIEYEEKRKHYFEQKKKYEEERELHKERKRQENAKLEGAVTIKQGSKTMVFKKKATTEIANDQETT